LTDFTSPSERVYQVSPSMNPWFSALVRAVLTFPLPCGATPTLSSFTIRHKPSPLPPNQYSLDLALSFDSLTDPLPKTPVMCTIWRRQADPPYEAVCFFSCSYCFLFCSRAASIALFTVRGVYGGVSSVGICILTSQQPPMKMNSISLEVSFFFGLHPSLFTRRTQHSMILCPLSFTSCSLFDLCFLFSFCGPAETARCLSLFIHI